MADIAIGQRIPSAFDLAYANYSAWCQSLKCKPAAFDAWLRMERFGPILSAAKGIFLLSRQEHDLRKAQRASQPHP